MLYFPNMIANIYEFQQKKYDFPNITFFHHNCNVAKKILNDYYKRGNNRTNLQLKFEL